MIIGICKEPIADYKSLDSEPIRLIVFIAADERDQDAYIRLLGSVSSKLKDPAVVSEIFENMKNKKKVLAALAKGDGE